MVSWKKHRKVMKTHHIFEGIYDWATTIHFYRLCGPLWQTTRHVRSKPLQRLLRRELASIPRVVQRHWTPSVEKRSGVEESWNGVEHSYYLLPVVRPEPLVAFLLLVGMPFAPSSFLFLVATCS